MSETVVVVGGGAAGALLVIQLARLASDRIDIVVLEPRSELGLGVAYSTEDPGHLLNAPAGEMSAFEGEPDDFCAWLESHRQDAHPCVFASRSLYGTYLTDVLERMVAAAHGRVHLTHVRDTAVAVRPSHDGGVVIGLARGGHVEAQDVVLALGAPLTSAPWARLDVSPNDRPLVADPWAPGALDVLAHGGVHLLLGTGLTMVDVATTISSRDPDARLVARSRHGLVPLPHLPGLQPSPVTLGLELESAELRCVVRTVRQLAADVVAHGGEWRAVVAAVRRDVPRLWEALTVREREAFVRHLARYWEIHRHRIAPAVAATLDDLRATKRLDVGKGRLVEIRTTGATMTVKLLSGAGVREELEVDGIVNCTGPARSYAGQPLVARLVGEGLVDRDDFSGGLAVDRNGLVAASGGLEGRVRALGWSRRSQEYETTAIPEIRRQATATATALLCDTVGRPLASTSFALVHQRS